MWDWVLFWRSFLLTFTVGMTIVYVWRFLRWRAEHARRKLVINGQDEDWYEELEREEKGGLA